VAAAGRVRSAGHVGMRVGPELGGRGDDRRTEGSDRCSPHAAAPVRQESFL